MHRLSEKDIISMTAICSECGPVDIYYRRHKDEYVCKTYRKNYARQKWRKNKYGEEAVAMPHFGPCDICGVDAKLFIDHDHSSGKIRGTLCHACNVGLGFFKDDVEVLRKAIAYL